MHVPSWPCRCRAVRPWGRKALLGKPAGAKIGVLTVVAFVVNRGSPAALPARMSGSTPLPPAKRPKPNPDGSQLGKELVEIAYVTDVEGNLEYFKRWVSMSRVLRYDRKGALDFTHNNAYFVYGGDVPDKGNGDIRFARQLVAFKRRYPQRVVLLVGNRDLNKLRLTAELGEADMQRSIDMIPGPYWDRKAPTLKQYLEQIAVAQGPAGAAAKFDSRAERLRYLFKHTLGCLGTFEYRRQELALLRGVADASEIGDEEVTQHFIDDVTAGGGGALRDYLESAEVAAILGNTLFVHGAVDVQNMGFVPDHNTRFAFPSQQQGSSGGRHCATAREWVVELNAFLKWGLQDHAERPDWDVDRTTRGGEALMALQNRAAMRGRTVISNCFCDGGVITNAESRGRYAEAVRCFESDPLAVEGLCSDPRDATVAAWLRSDGVRRVVVGHKPSGDSPAILKASDEGSLEVISADTSFSDQDAADNRGKAMACVLLRGTSLDVNHAVIYGVLRDGRHHEARLQTLGGLEDGKEGDPFLGTEFKDGWWVKALVPEASSYLLCRGKGRRVEYRDIERNAMHMYSRM